MRIGLLWMPLLVACSVASFPARDVRADFITGGSATITIDVNQMSTPAGALSFDRFYGSLGNEAATLTRNQMVTPSGPPFPGSPTAPVDLEFVINPATVTSPTGRRRQGTTLDFERSGVLNSWAPSTVGAGTVSGGEQIGLDGVIRTTVSDDLGGGTFVLGDFALRYAPSLADGNVSGLVVTSNFDFFNTPLFYIGNTSIVATAGSLTISGDLLLTEVYTSFFGGTARADVGDFRLVATTAVPEPGALTLLGSGLVALGLVCRRVRPRTASGAEA